MSAAFDSDVDVAVEMAFTAQALLISEEGRSTNTMGYASAPDSAGLSPTGDIDLRFFGAAESWISGDLQRLILRTSGGQASYVFSISEDDGLLDLFLSQNGSTIFGEATSTVPVDAADGERLGVRATWRQSDNRVQFFTSTDDGASWVQLGADVTLDPTITGIHDSTGPVLIGASGPGVFAFVGRVFRAEIRSGIDGTIGGGPVFADLTQWTVGEDAGDTGTDAQGNVWTLVNTAEIVDAPSLFNTFPVWIDISEKVKSVSFQRGRSSVQDDFPAGSGELFLDNTGGEFYPWNTVSPYYPNVTVGIQVRITATHNSVSYPLFRGYVSRWPLAFPTNVEELARVEMTESFARLQDKKVSDSFIDQTTDQRIGSVLDAVGWPVPSRNLESGVADVAARVWDKVTALFLMRTATEAEQGQLFQAANGDLTFLNRVAGTGAASQATFGPDGAELIYVDVTVVHDDDLLVNEALITGRDGSEQSALDAISTAAHGPVTYSTENLSITGASAAANVAEWIVAKHKDIKDRIVGLVVDPAGSPTALWPEVLGRELRDIITVEASYPGSTTQLVQAVAVESISHSFEAAGVWTVVYGCHPLSALEQKSFWILGTSQLGTTTVLA